METSTSPQKQAIGKDVYTIITEKIIEQLEKGTVPWHKPWYEAGLPKNLITGRNYQGINVWLLSYLGYDQNYFLTFNQLTELGGRVKKDEKGHQVVYWNYPKKDGEKAEDTEDNQEPKKVPTLRYYTVFNIAQCEGIPADKLPVAETRDFNPINSCQIVVDAMQNRPVIQFKQQRAYYNPLEDFINMPKQKSFDTEEAYYSTLFHELVHSTGHHSRLNRKDLIQMAEFGSESYSHEELLAEIGTCYLQSYTGITSQFEQSAAYIQGWLWKLKNEKRFIFSASTQAQKAVDFILNIQSETDELKED